MFGLPQDQDEGPTVLSEVRGCESERGARHSIEVYGYCTSELVRYYRFFDPPLNSRRSLGRKEILDSKSHKRLQELNLVLDQRAAALDDERATLANVLQDYSAGMVLERALHELCAELAVLEAQDVALRQQVTQETQKLSRLEQKVREC
jgi:hypothetical protein